MWLGRGGRVGLCKEGRGWIGDREGSKRVQTEEAWLFGSERAAFGFDIVSVR